MAIDEQKESSTATKAPATRRVRDTEKKLDFADLKNEWGGLLDKLRPDTESGLLHVTTRINKLDPIAEKALATVKEQFSCSSVEERMRKLVSSKGWATELDKAIKRINRLRMSENKRVVLAAVYPGILHEVLTSSNLSDADANKLVKDDKGVVEEILFELEKKNGALDVFAQTIVELVGQKNRVKFTQDNVMRNLITHQVRVSL